jgi:hypothetical protein
MKTIHTIIELAAAVGLTTGCVSTRSSAGSFVTDVRVEGDQLQVERCRLDVEVSHRDGLRFLLFPLMVVSPDGGGLFTRRSPEVSKCATTGAVMVDTKGGAS